MSYPDAKRWHESRQTPSRGPPPAASSSAASSSNDRPSVPPAPAVFSRWSGQDSLDSSASRMAFPARLIAAPTWPAKADPACRTTACAPIASPDSNALVREANDFLRSERSVEAQLMRYTAWMRVASIGESSTAERNAATSSSVYTRDRHARGLWLKNWIAVEWRSTPRSIAFAGPPAEETWAPTSI